MSALAYGRACDEILPPILITTRHLAKRAPIWKYSAMRLARPSRPSVTFSPGESASSTVPLSTLMRSEEHTSELQSQSNLVCRLLLEKKKKCITCTYTLILSSI